MAQDDPFQIEFDTKTVEKLLEKTPRRIAKALSKGSVKALRRYGGFHRARRMKRQSISERLGIFATRGSTGLSNQKWIKVRELGGSNLGDAGAEARIRNIIFRQLEHGATIRAKAGSALLVPTKDNRNAKGKTTTRAKRLLQSNRVRRVKTSKGTFLVHHPGYPRKASKAKRPRRRRKLDRPWQFLFLLRDSIRVPKRTEFKELFVREYPKEVVKAVEFEITRVVEKVNQGRS